jgi:hypothetical protein
VDGQEKSTDSDGVESNTQAHGIIEHMIRICYQREGPNNVTCKRVNNVEVIRIDATNVGGPFHIPVEPDPKIKI